LEEKGFKFKNLTPLLEKRRGNFKKNTFNWKVIY
jgi:hypothetical protein